MIRLISNMQNYTSYQIFFEYLKELSLKHQHEVKTINFEDSPLKLRSEAYDMYFLLIDSKSDLTILSKIKDYNKHALIVFISIDENLIFDTLFIQPFHFIRKHRFKEDFEITKQLLEKFFYENEAIYTFAISQTMKMTLKISNIYYIESLNHHIYIHTNTDTYKVRKQLRSVSTTMKLRSSAIIQIHKSYLINLQHVHKVERNEIILKNRKKLPIGRTYKLDLIENYENYEKKKIQV